jgi:hypothetical protein
LAGGTPIVITDAPQTFGAAWLPDNAIVFADSRFTGLKRVSDAGGPPVMLTKPAAGELGHAWPDALDGGRAIVFTAATSPSDGDAGPIAVVPYEPGAPGRVRAAHTTFSAAESARAAGPDYIAYTRRDELYAIPFDRTRLIAAGNEQPIGPRVAPLQFAISRSGALVFGPSLVTLGADPMIWPLGSEARLPLTGLGRARAAMLSPDGRRVAIVSTDDASSDIWVRDLERRTTTRITHGGINATPIWSADSTTLYYAARPSARFEVWRRDAAATSPAMSVASRDDAHLFPTSVVGDRLVFTAANQGTSIWMMPTVGGPASGLVDSAYDDVAGVLSPDNKLLAYQSDDSGRWEIYLLRLSDKRRTSVSSGGGVAPFWSPDGTMLYYTSGGRLMGATVKHGEPSTAALISSLPNASRPIGIAPDGVVRLTSDVTARPDRAVLTLEWGRELRQLLGPPGPSLIR